MSSTNRGEYSNSSWETPRWVVNRLLEEIDLPTGLWLEPCAGNGRIIQAVNYDRPGQIRWSAVELQANRYDNLKKIPNVTAYNEDFLKWGAKSALKDLGVKYDPASGRRYYDVSIGNYPFELSMDVLSKCLVLADHVVMLQRINWLGGGSNNGKNGFLRDCMPDVYPLPDRIRFLQDGVFPRYPEGYKNRKLVGRQMPGDSIEYAWYYWGPTPARFQDFGRVRNLRSTPVEERTEMELLDLVY